MPITFFVPGVPVPKGSAKAFYRKGMRFPVVIQDNVEKQKPWASIIAIYAQQAGAHIETGPVKISINFTFDRPKGHFRSNGLLKPSAPGYHLKKPDSDKLCRLVLDALTSIAWIDDSQVVELHCTKHFGKPGAQITLDNANW